MIVMETTDRTERTVKHGETEKRRRAEKANRFSLLHLRCFVPPCFTVSSVSSVCLVAFAALMLAAAACGARQQSAERTAVTYPEPRFPSYLKPPASIDDVLPHVRPLARNKSGFQGNGLGIAQPGDTVAFILPATAEDMIVQAVKRAMEERGVKVNLVPDYEVAGVTREDAAAFEKARRTFTAEQG